MTKFFAALAFVGLNFWIYNYFATTPVVPERETFDSFPATFDGWSCAEQQQMPDEVASNLGVTDYLICDYVNLDKTELVNVYVGYHQSQVREEGGGAGENSIHPPAHCLPGSGWDIVENESVSVDMPGLPQTPAAVKRLIIARGQARQLTYYWYQSRGRVISDDWKKIVFVGLDRATRGRTDGSLVRFTVPVLRNDVERAERAFRAVAPQIIAQLPAYVPE